MPRAEPRVETVVQQVIKEVVVERQVEVPVMSEARTVFVDRQLPEAALLQEAMSTQAGRKVSLEVPQRGTRRRLLDAALALAEKGATPPGRDNPACFEGARSGPLVIERDKTAGEKPAA